MPISSDKEICQRIAQIRLEVAGQRGKAKFANMLGLSPSTYDYYESSRVPPARVLVDICDVSGADIGWLLSGRSSGTGSAGDHPIVRRLAAMLDEHPNSAGPLAAFLDLLHEAQQKFPAELPGDVLGEALEAPTGQRRRNGQPPRTTLTTGGLIPVLGRSAAGVPQFWAQGAGAGVTELGDLIQRHVVGDIGAIQQAVSEDADGSNPTQIVTMRADPAEGPCQFIRADTIKARHPDAFALQIDGESMAPEIRHGDWVVLSPSAPAADGRPAVVQLTGQIGVTCKLYRAGGRKVHLIPIREDLAPMTVGATEVVWALQVLACVRPLNDDAAPIR